MFRFIGRIAFLVCVFGLAVQTTAEARPHSYSTSCQKAKSLVRKKGQIVFSTGIFTYARFVSSRRYCKREETMEHGYGRTSDKASCFIGFKCVPAINDHNTPDTNAAPAGPPAGEPEPE